MTPFPISTRAQLDPAELAPDVLVLVDSALPPGTVAAPPGIAVRFLAFRAENHAPACACCAGASPLARALLALLGARARGEVPFFRRVLAVSDAAGRAALREAVRRDPLLGTRYSV